MWNVSGNSLSMCEGDWGVKLPVKVSGVTFAANDSLKFAIKNGEATIIEKEYTNIAENTVNLEMTEAETSLLPVGSYVYRLDWYQNGSFMCNIIPISTFKVVDKA